MPDFYHQLQEFRHIIINSIKEKINCDYAIHKNNKTYYIEIAGLLYSKDDLNKRFTERKERYRRKMKKKTELLEKSNINSLVLYSKDMQTGFSCSGLFRKSRLI